MPLKLEDKKALVAEVNEVAKARAFGGCRRVPRLEAPASSTSYAKQARARSGSTCTW